MGAYFPKRCLESGCILPIPEEFTYKQRKRVEEIKNESLVATNNEIIDKICNKYTFIALIIASFIIFIICSLFSNVVNNDKKML